MSMAAITFDSLDYFEKLKDAGVPEAQAKVQANTLQTALNRYDEASRKELATRGDLQDVRSELKEDIQDVRTEIQNVRTELKEDIQNVRNEIQNVRTELKEDIQNVRNEIQDVRTELKEDIQDVRLEVEKVRAQSRESELRLQAEIEKVRKEIQGTETRLIKWQLGIAAGIVSVMLTGFGAMATIMAKSLGWSGF